MTCRLLLVIFHLFRKNGEECCGSIEISGPYKRLKYWDKENKFRFFKSKRKVEKRFELLPGAPSKFNEAQCVDSVVDVELREGR